MRGGPGNVGGVQIRIRLVSAEPPEGWLWMDPVDALDRPARWGEPMRFAGWLDLLRTLDEVIRADERPASRS
jgi:hypothetical protein